MRNHIAAIISCFNVVAFFIATYLHDRKRSLSIFLDSVSTRDNIKYAVANILLILGRMFVMGWVVGCVYYTVLHS